MHRTVLKHEFDFDSATLNSDESLVCFLKRTGEFLSGSLEEITTKLEGHSLEVGSDLSNEEQKILLDADKFKFLVHFHNGFFHSMRDTYTTIYRLNEFYKAKNIKWYCVLFVFEENRKNSLFEFLLEALQALKVEYVCLNISKIINGDIVGSHGVLQAYKIKNYRFLKDLATLSSSDSEYLHKKYMPSSGHVKAMIDNMIIPVVGSGSTSNKKIYISRKKDKRDGLPDYVKVLPGGFRDDIRVHNEQLLEEELADAGFEVVYAEEIETFKEQVSLMQSAKVLVGASGSGMFNLMFMPDGGIVVELRVEHMMWLPEPESDPAQILISDYADMAQIKNHLYIGIPVHDKEAEKVVDRIRTLTSYLILEENDI